ncbi:MAG TPA: DNA polymerase III subunit epsilon [Usitatibacteraceae bacterium]|nr:DNA polymerase III subunit epsilon [Usitatibacteraceae bacterium]
MRRIVLDTETTGLEVVQGHRVIEIACVELFDRRPTGRNFHRYLNPDREIDAGAIQVHGLTTDFLADKPHFPDIADEFIEFVEGAELLIHNAPFDVGFLNAEFALMGRPGIETICPVTDTLAMAREMHPGKRNSLDVLCERYQVDNSRRSLHGALLDAQLLADVWLAMTRGQDTLDISLMAEPAATAAGGPPARPARLEVLRASAAELAAHAAMCERIDRESRGRCLWKQAAPAG